MRTTNELPLPENEMGFFSSLVKTKRKVNGWRRRNGLSTPYLKKSAKEAVRRFKNRKK